ncbi:MAG: elongation factor G [Firmicutes bacterium]|nr:elongation factor G [Bacillota bacterium]MBQ1400845.1 elongation factor G [Bacillota bacterium]MBQ2677536.1 elongation factor G [Bacillota bacterium]MBR2511712.1 elongation factor G [Bacillota bacterium]MDO4859910.1 elongation factor G [Bacillota bacterium]
MKGYTSDNIRNVALVGHGGSGKTTFLESCLLATKVVSRLGKVEDGNTVSDWDKMEIEKGYSINTSIVPIEYNKVKINFVDTPGFFDFVGEVNAALRAVEAAAIVVDASAGIEVGTEKAWASCKKFGVPRFFLINKIEKDNVEMDQLIADLKSQFGTAVVTLDDRDALNEAIAETDEELMEKYFSGEEFTDAEFNSGMSKGISEGDIVPIIQVSALEGTGVEDALQTFIDLVPKATDHAPYPAKDGSDADIEVAPDPAGNPVALVFKTIADQVLGKISLAKVISGSFKSGQDAYNSVAEKSEKLGTMFFLRGKNREDTTEVCAGDIVAFGKLQNTKTGDTLCDKGNLVKLPTIEFPQPTLYQAVEPKSKGDEEKVGTGLNRLMEEDPSFVLERNNETHQTLLGGQGEMQLNIIKSKLKDKFGADVDTVPQKIAYRETIKGTSDVQGKHKKQTGGAGQYGDVHIKFSPSQEEFEFTESLFGGSIPKNYVPAVEKGLRESMEKGPLAGCKVVNIKADLYDGSYHDVDSNEMAFKIAASLAFKKGIVEANPCLLEPVMKVEITVPDEYMGDIMGDMNKRRGKILGSEPLTGGGQKVIAEAPQAELFDYAITVRSMTQARGTFTMEFERYEPVPAHLAEKIIAAHKAEEEDK